MGQKAQNGSHEEMPTVRRQGSNEAVFTFATQVFLARTGLCQETGLC